MGICGKPDWPPSCPRHQPFGGRTALATAPVPWKPVMETPGVVPCDHWVSHPHHAPTH